MRHPRFLPQNAQNLRVSQHAKVAFRHEQELLTKDREDNRALFTHSASARTLLRLKSGMQVRTPEKASTILDVLFFGKVEYLHCFVVQKFTARKSTNHLIGASSTRCSS